MAAPLHAVRLALQPESQGVGMGAPVGPGAPEAPRPFAGVMQEAIAQVSQTHSQAQNQLQTFRSGQGELRWEEVAQSLEQARLSLQEMMHLRAHLVSAYQGLQGDAS